MIKCIKLQKKPSLRRFFLLKQFSSLISFLILTYSIVRIYDSKINHILMRQMNSVKSPQRHGNIVKLAVQLVQASDNQHCSSIPPEKIFTGFNNPVATSIRPMPKKSLFESYSLTISSPPSVFSDKSGLIGLPWRKCAVSASPRLQVGK